MVLLLLAACSSGDPDTKPSDTAADADTDSDTDTDTDTDSDSDTDTDTDTDTDADTDTTWDPAGDSDADGITDADEGRADGRDSDADGTPDYLDIDSDADGLPDAAESEPRDYAGAVPDTDADGTPDYLDDDSDDDGLSDTREGGAYTDTDGDGTADYRDTDADDDGLLDRDEGTDDWDNDGTVNFRDSRNDGALAPITLTAISTEFNSPIGIDYEEYSGTVVISVNYPTGDPLALETVAADGSHAPFSTLAYVTDEVKIATVRSGNTAGFSTGELFMGNGTDGQIVRISADGATVTNPWVDLPGASNGLMRGSLYVDRTGVFNDDLIVVTTVGQVFEVDAAGTATLLADVGVHLEGLVTVPDAPTRFGPLAGKILAGAEDQRLMYAFAPDGSYTTYDLGVAIEDMDYVVPFENFFGVNYGTSTLLGTRWTEFLPIAGDILVTSETVSSVGLYRLWWDGTSLHADELQKTADSASVGQWEHTTFAACGIQEVPD